MTDEIRRGEEAQRLLDEPLLKEAFSVVESVLIDAIKRVDVGAKDRHQDLIVSLQLLGKVKGHLEQVVMTGKMAAITKERESWADKIRRRVA